MKNVLILTFLLLLSIKGNSQKVDVIVVKSSEPGISEWQIIDNHNNKIQPVNDLSGDSVLFTLEANREYSLQVSVIELFDSTKVLYTLILNGEPLLLVRSDLEQGVHFFPFFTGIKYTPDKIIGGTNANISEFPWQVLFRSGNYMCGGSLIDRQWVVTAAHCTQESNGSSIPVDQMYIVAGATNPFNRNEGTAYRVTQMIVHENYNRQSLTNDIALLRLEAPVTVLNANPVRLLNSDDVNEGAITPGVMSWVTGWGLTRVNPDEFPQILQKAQMPIVSNTQAATVWGSISSTILMAGYLNGNKDACSGDSGGPLVVPVSGEYKLAGIVSWGSEDCDTYSGFTKVSDFNTWIRNRSGIAADFAPSVPSGDEVICPGQTSSQYSVTPVQGASIYEWELFPDEAGTISANSHNATVQWRPHFFGDVTVKVRVSINNRMSEWSRLDVRLARNTRILSQSGSRQVCMRESLTLNVSAEGDDLRYNWYKDGNLVRTGTPDYTISSAGNMHTGNYSVEVVGLCGTVTSSVMRIEVLPLTNITYVTADTTILFGNDANLVVFAEGHNLTYHWLKNEDPLSVTLNTLELPSVTANDIGVYQAVVTGTCGVRMSNEFYVYVEPETQNPEKDIFVWPSVTADILNVALSNDEIYEIKIFNTAGALLLQKRNNRFVTTLDVSKMGRGIYIINVSYDNIRKSLKFIKI